MNRTNVANVVPASEVSEKEKPAKDKSTREPLARSNTDIENPVRDVASETLVNGDLQPIMPGSDQAHPVDWDGPHDPNNPQNWKGTRKWVIIVLVSAITFNQ